MASQDFFDMTAQVVSRSQPEELERINELVQSIYKYDEAIKAAVQGSQEYNTAITNKNQAIQSAIEYTNQLNNAILSQVQLLDTIDLTDYSNEETALIYKEALQLQKDITQQNVELGVVTADQIEAWTEALPILLALKEAGMESIEGISSDYISMAINKLKDEGTIKGGKKDTGVGFQSFDMSQAELANVVEGPQYANMVKELTGLGYKLDEQTEIAITNEGTMTKYTKDWKVVQYLLQGILDVNQKQLDGMYNLPDGASFWVPYEAAKLMGVANSSGDNAAFKEMMGAANVMDQAADKMLDAANKGAEDTTTTPIEKTPMQKFREWEEKYPATNEPKYKTTEEQMQAFRAQEQKYPTTATEEKPTVFDTLETLFRSLIETLKFDPNGLAPNPGDQTSRLQQPIVNPVPTSNKISDLNNVSAQNVSTKLSLNIENRTMLQLDGRQIAMVVKQYLKNDLVRYSGSGSSRSLSVI